MQVQTPEVSAEKATTPAADLRLVSVEQLKKIHRELDACQKVIWLAGCRPRVPGGFDPAYVTGAQEQLKVIEELLASQSAAVNEPPHILLAVGVDASPEGAHVCVTIKGAGEMTHVVHSQFYKARQDGATAHSVCVINSLEESEPRGGKTDSLYRDAVEAVVKNQRASVAFVQRRLCIGYNRAARMIEAMERDRIISGINSDGARAVLVLEVPNA